MKRASLALICLVTACGGPPRPPSPDSTPAGAPVVPVYYGTEHHGTGGDPDRDNSWFLGDEPVTYCVEVAPGSLFEKTVYERTARAAFDDWKAFFLHYGYDEKTIGGPPWAFRFPDGKPRRLSLDFQVAATCNDPVHQVRIVFSEKPPITPRFETPSGFRYGAVSRGPYDSDTYRTGGTVWVHSGKRPRGPSLREESIKHILLHELGHVFGMRHNETWVMHAFADEDTFGRKASMVGRSYDPYLGKIERPGWKFRWEPGDEVDFDQFQSTSAIWEALEKDLGTKQISPEILRYEGTTETGEKRFTLRIGEQLLEGRFAAEKFTRVDLAWGPSIFLPWVLNGIPPEQLLWRKPHLLSFEAIPAEVPAVGQFELGDKIFPAQLRHNQGTVLNLYVPSARAWVLFYVGAYRDGVRNDLDL